MNRIESWGFGGGLNMATLQQYNAVNCHFGHYWCPQSGFQDDGAVDGSGNLSDPNWATLKSELISCPTLIGLTWRERWVQMEPTQGNYDFTNLDRRYNELAAIGKRLIVLIPTRTFKTTDHIVPIYMQDPAYEGGEHEYVGINGGFNINWWNANVQARAIALAQAIANHFKGKPFFEGVVLSETARGTRVGTDLNTAEDNGYYDGMLMFLQALKTTAPNLLVAQYCNSPKSRMTDYVPAMVDMAVGISCPDTWIDPDQSNSGSVGDLVGPTYGIYYYFVLYHNVVATIASWQPDNFRWSVVKNVGVVPAIQQLHDASRTSGPALNVNYVIVTRDDGGDIDPRTGLPYPDFSQQVIAFLNEPAQANAPAGRLNTSKPSKYSAMKIN